MSIVVLEDRIFCLHTRNTSYIMRIENNEILQCAYWGAIVPEAADYLSGKFPNPGRRIDAYREECSSFGTMHFKEASLKLRFEDGTRDFRPKVGGWNLDGEHLVIVLEDSDYPFSVRLHYRVYEQEDIIEKWREAVYGDSGTVVLERFHSAEFGISGTDYESMNFNGAWSREFCLGSSKINAGKIVYESMFGLTGHMTGPFFVVHRDADEENGEVYFGMLAFSGNHKIVVEVTPHHYTSILAGMSDTDFEVHLNKDIPFETPHVYAGYTPEGFDAMSNRLARFAREQILPRHLRNKTLPVLYNSWYATTFNVTVEGQMTLAEKAARMGIELFVVDDGWFSGRSDDRSGLGDWTPDEKKFPQGLAPLIEKVNSLGMSFGVWIEPEMVNQDSDLFRAHPDWIFRYNGREVITSRNQYCLDFSNPAVLSYLKDRFDVLFLENNIRYVKWDMNRYAAEMGSAACRPELWKELWYRNTCGVYELRDYFMRKYPDIEFESCASGGGRIDYQAMAFFDEFWPSDNTDPLDRLFIQEHYSMVYPVRCMRAWLTDDFDMNGRRIPVRFGMHSAMCGVLGIGSDLGKKSDEELEEMARYIAEYKTIRATVQFGNIHRLKSPDNNRIHAVQYTKKYQTVLFVFLERGLYSQKEYPLKLRGLEEDALYSFRQDDATYEKTGAFLMRNGLLVTLTGDYASELFVFKRLDTR